MMMDPSLKTIFLAYTNLSSLSVMKANCSARVFNPVQCDYDISSGNQTWCYCVDQSGRTIRGSGVASPRLPRCGDMHCDVGHRLYNKNGSGDARKCNPWSSPCPAGYECKHVAYGQHVCCIDHYGHSDICRQTPNPGQWCNNMEGKWSNYYYYNSTMRKCKLFLYRGCNGNQNMFSTEAACNQRCARKEKPGMCPRMMELSLNQRYCNDSCMDDRSCTEDRKCCQTHCGRRCTMPIVDDNEKKCRVGVEYHHPNGSKMYCGRGQPRCPDGYMCNVDPVDGPSFCCPKETEPLNICHEPKETGVCRAMMHRYFFNRTSEQCERFIYGGCRGNNNNFNSLQECCSQCGTNATRCKPGKCPKPQANYFAPCKDECNTDGECKGNTLCCFNGCGRSCLVPEMKNTCHTKFREAHMKIRAHREGCPMISIPRCNPDGTWRPQQCLDSYGVCWCVDSLGHKIPGTFARGYASCTYVSGMQRRNTSMPEMEMDLPTICEDGTKARCCDANLCHMNSCPGHPAAVCRINPCGGCRAVFYDEMNKEVNCNEGLTKCQIKRHQVKTALTQHKVNMMATMTDMLGNMTRNMTMGDNMMPGPMENTDSMPAHCQLAPETGMCKAYMPKWFFNSTTNRCEKFVYGGCQGNDNKFNTAEECYKGCNKDANPCKVKKCRNQQTCYLAIDHSCERGKCAHWAQCSSTDRIPARCQLAPEPGMCEAYMPKWFFNSTTNRCEMFVYGGCQGNDNNFYTAEECYKGCNEDANPCKIKKCGGQRKCSLVTDRSCDKGKCAHWAKCSYTDSIPAHCQLAPETGMCRAYMPKWFFNHTTNRCEKFIYGGCQGNDNKFNTVEECYKDCNEDANSCKTKNCGEQQKCNLAIDHSCEKGKCAHWAQCSYMFSNPHMTGVHLPTCSAQKFNAMQCQHGYCWCVDADGNAIEGSLAKKYGLICQDDGRFTVLEGKAVTCNNGAGPYLRCLDTCMNKVCPGKPKATCVADLCSNSCSYKFMMGSEEVECGADECAVMYAEPKPSCQVEPACPRKICPNVCEDQTCGSDPCAMCRVDPCTCQAVFTDMMTNMTITDCAAVSHTHCQMTWCSKMMEKHREMLMTSTTSISLPTCETDGRYEPRQCEGDQCWCVDGVGQWLKSSSLDNVCGRNETVKIVIEMKFNNDFSLVANKMYQFKRALVESIIEAPGMIDADYYITEIQVYEGSIVGKLTLEDREDVTTPSTKLPVLADRIENRIKSGDMKLTFEGTVLVADTGLYSRTDRFEAKPPIDLSTTTIMPTYEPEPEPEPLEEKFIIIISVLAGVVGLIILSVLVYCCCCQRKNKSETDSTSGSSDYSIEKKQDFQSRAVTNDTYGMVYPGTDNRSYKQDEDFIKVRL